MEDSSAVPFMGYCHVCHQTAPISLNHEREYQCDICQYTFVEHLGQGVETFLTPVVAANAEAPAAEAAVQRTISGVEEAAVRRAAVAIASASSAPLSAPSLTTIASMPVLAAVTGAAGAGAAGAAVLGGNGNATTTASANVNGSGSGGTMLSGSLMRLVSSLLEMRVQNGSEQTSLLSMAQQAATSSGRPVEIVVRRGPSVRRELNSTLAQLAQLRESMRYTQRLSHLLTQLEDENSQFERILHHILMNEPSRAGAPPASEELMATLPRQRVETIEAIEALGECGISLAPFELGDTVVTLPCQHLYKEENILHWLRMHGTCPICRIDLQTLDLGITAAVPPAFTSSSASTEADQASVDQESPLGEAEVEAADEEDQAGEWEEAPDRSATISLDEVD